MTARVVVFTAFFLAALLTLSQGVERGSAATSIVARTGIAEQEFNLQGTRADCAPTATTCSIDTSGHFGTGSLDYTENWDSGQFQGVRVIARGTSTEQTGGSGRAFYVVDFVVTEATSYEVVFNAQNMTGNSHLWLVTLRGGGFPDAYWRRVGVHPNPNSQRDEASGARTGVIQPSAPGTFYRFSVDARGGPTVQSPGCQQAPCLGTPNSAELDITLILGVQDQCVESTRSIDAGLLVISSAICEGPAVIDTLDGQIPIDADSTTLELKSLPPGIDCEIVRSQSPDCTYQWFRSGTQGRGNFVHATDGSFPGNERYRLDNDGRGNDTGHWFYLEVTDPDGNRAVSNEIGVGPSGIPELGHPNNEEVRVGRPVLNLRNVTTPDLYFGSQPYEYEFQISSDPTFPATGVVAFMGPEQTANHGISYGQGTSTLAAGAYHWRARAMVGGAGGRWSASRPFSIANVWSEDGQVWHSPLDAAARLTGTFGEAYFHEGYFPDNQDLHLGVDFGVCATAVRTAIGGTLNQRSLPVRLGHPAISRQTQYHHMSGVTALPLGTFVNQGTQIGTASNVPSGPCHLHFDVTDAAATPTTYYNPLQFLPPGAATNVGDPTVAAVLLRRELSETAAYVDTTALQKVALGGDVYVVGGLNDPNGGNNLAPERVEFLVNGAAQRIIDFTQPLTADDYERDYYAYRNAGGRTTPAARPGAVYYPYFKWDTSGLNDAGPQTAEVRASNHEGVTASRTITVGPEITTPAFTVCGSGMQVRNIRVENRNVGLEDLPAAFAANGDRYRVQVDAPGFVVAVATPLLPAVAGGGGVDLTLRTTLLPRAADEVTVTVRVLSGLLTDVGDSITVTLRRTC